MPVASENVINWGYEYYYIDMTPGFVDLSEIWANEKRAPGYQMEINL